jgi:large subunit ribosomal protein L24
MVKVITKKPTKQRKRLYNLPLHLKQKQVRSQLSKDLKKKYSKRNMGVRKGDTVEVMHGSFKGKKGKITTVNLKKGFLNIEGINRKVKDGREIMIKLDPSNVMLIELNLDDDKRFKNNKSTADKV